jgi:hypothetical protein
MPALAPNTGSIIQRPDGNDATFTGLATNIVIRVGAVTVGAIQSLTVNEARSVTMISEIGTDGAIDSAPNSSTKYSGDCKRVRFDRVRITEAFARGFIHIKAQRIPFDFDIYDIFNGDGNNAIVTTVRNVWITQLSDNYDVSNWILIQSMSWEAEDIYSNLNGSNAATGGLLGSNILQLNSVERASDRGSRLGALDAPGLSLDFFSNA